MADELKLSITLDTTSIDKSFKDVEKKAKQSTGKLENTFSDVRDFVNNPFIALGARLGAIGIIAETAAKVIKKAFDFSLLGEQTKAINTQFKLLSESVGIVSEDLKSSIESATRGLIDDEDALQIANKAIVALGESAKDLPKILDLSRNASKTLGKDFKDTFESFSSFVETGNAKALKQYGIVLDVAGALEKYAKSIGLTSAQLTIQQEQQVRLNLLLTETQSKFLSTTESVTPLSDALRKLNVTINNTSEDVAVKFDTVLGPAVVRIINSFDTLVKKGPTLGQGLAFLISPAATISEGLINASKKADDFSNVGLKELENESKNSSLALEELSKKLVRFNELGLAKTNPIAVDSVKSDIENAKKELDRITFEIISRKQQAENDIIFGGRGSSSPVVTAKLTADQLKIINDNKKKNELELTKFLNDQNVVRLQSDLAVVNEKDLFAAKQLDIELRASQEIKILQVQESQKLKDVDVQFSKDKLFNVEQREQAINATISTFASQRQKIENDASNKILELESLAGEKRKLQAQQASAAVKSILVSSTTDYVETIGQRLQKGEVLFEDFGESVAALFGDLAINIGKALFVQGLAIEAFITSINSLLPGSGLAAAALGLGLILFGSALKASVGKGGSSAPSSGGGVASSPSDTTSLTPDQNITRNEPNTSVQVVIQGDVLDSDESGSRIVDLINQAFDKKGVVIQQGISA